MGCASGQCECMWGDPGCTKGGMPTGNPSPALPAPTSPHFPPLQCSQAAQLELGWSGGPDAALPFLNKITDAGVSVCNSLSTRILLGRRSKVGRAQPGGCSAHSPPPHPPALPVDVVVPVQVQHAAGHLARHPLQSERVWGHGVSPPAAPQVSLQVTLQDGATVTTAPSRTQWVPGPKCAKHGTAVPPHITPQPRLVGPRHSPAGRTPSPAGRG